MKIFTLITLLVFSCEGMASGSSERNEKKSQNFEKKKERMLKRIARRKANLISFEACVQAATDRSALKACRQAQKDQRKARRKQRTEKKAN